MEKILKKANELGHLLRQNEIVKRMHELSDRLDKDEEARTLLEDLVTASGEYQRKEQEGKPIEAEEKRKLSELNEKTRQNALLGEYLATQAYYMNLLTQVNEAIANPTGDPPKDSGIILPGEDRGIIIS